MTKKLTPEQQAYLNGYREGRNNAFNQPEADETSEHCDDSTPERIKGYLEGQHSAFKLLEEQFGLIEIGEQIDNIKDVGRKKYQEGYEDGIMDIKRSILYKLVKAAESNPQLKPVQAILITELFKIINPDETYDMETY
jgi:hypothetical protein